MPTNAELLVGETPPVIDAEVFAQLRVIWAATDRIERAVDYVHNAVGDRREYGWGRGERQGIWKLSDNDALAQAAEKVDTDPRIKKLLDGIAHERELIAAARAEVAILDAEFTRRHGWTRAFLVDNADGHVHNTDRCSSFRVGTRYHWLTELSGQPETEIVEQAGERACTVCYPSAPVDVLKRPSKLEGPAQIAAREAAAQRKAEKTARDAAKAEKAITNPDGSVLRGKHGPIATVVTAWRELIDDIFTHRYYSYSLDTAVNDRIVAALVAKLGQSEQEIRTQVEAKVAAKAKREITNR